MVSVSSRLDVSRVNFQLSVPGKEPPPPPKIKFLNAERNSPEMERVVKIVPFKLLGFRDK